jgi:hypothetical protein
MNLCVFDLRIVNEDGDEDGDCGSVVYGKDNDIAR